MPAATAKTIKRRIKSVRNTRKITKAMELVAASKMRRAIQSVLGTRPFAKLSWETIRAVSRAAGEIDHYLLRENTESNKILLVLFTSDRGLAGAFNANMIKAAIEQVKKIEGEGMTIDAVCVGRKGLQTLERRKTAVVAHFEELSNKPRFEDIVPVARLVLDEYKKGTYRKVIVAYTDFISALLQKPNVIELLPLGTPEKTDELGSIEKRKAEAEPRDATEYIFEPDPKQVLERVLPRLVETMMYQALLESSASEHSARMLAMRNASDAAGEMLDDLTFTYNRIRQAGITQEIAEISSGKAALE